MNERIKVLVFMLLVIFTLSDCGAATGIDVSHAWARPAMHGDNGAVYFLLQNRSAGKDELTGISSASAEAVEIHVSQKAGDVIQMRQWHPSPSKARRASCSDQADIMPCL